MEYKVKREVEELIKKYNLNISVEGLTKETFAIGSWDFWFMKISLNEKLSEGFIREFKNRVSWGYVCNKQNLSEDFIREFKNEILWGYDNVYRNLSQEFVHEMKDMMNEFCFNYCIRNDYTTKKIIVKKDYENRIHSRFEILDL